ncbi:MAG: hypothetical protein DDG60_02870 [Anaerolineae bacterium]|nr:MAG: hypothetical protein DDG60_02870 [Anaerolineae bacterium]
MTRKHQAQGGPIYNIQGGIQAGRDVIMGDQIINTQNISNIQNQPQFVEALQRLEAEIEKLKAHPGLKPAQAKAVKAAQAKVNEAILETKKPAPPGEHIHKTLDSAKQSIEKLSGSIEAAIGLGTVLAQLGQLALKLFGH